MTARYKIAIGMLIALGGIHATSMYKASVSLVQAQDKILQAKVTSKPASAQAPPCTVEETRATHAELELTATKLRINLLLARIDTVDADLKSQIGRAVSAEQSLSAQTQNAMVLVGSLEAARKAVADLETRLAIMVKQRDAAVAASKKGRGWKSAVGRVFGTKQK
jgi:hypothetical protein